MLLDKKHSGHNSGVFLEDQSNIREVRKKKQNIIGALIQSCKCGCNIRPRNRFGLTIMWIIVQKYYVYIYIYII